MDREEFKAMLKEALAESLQVVVEKDYSDWSGTRLTVKVKFDNEVISSDYCNLPG